MSTPGQCAIQLKKGDFELTVRFAIPKKGVLGIFGHSGSGKTTLLRCLAGLEKNVKGQLQFNDQVWLDKRRRVSAQQRNIGYVFQDSRLFPHLSVRDNLEYGCKRSGKLNEKNKAYLIRLLDIEPLLDRQPELLSGGEKQRVAIARALLKSPQLLLMDEPMASLDQSRKNEILPYLERLHDQLSIPIVYVSHSLEEVSRLCDYMVVLESGKVIYKGTIVDALTSVKSPLLSTDHSIAVLNARVVSVDEKFSLSTVATKNGSVFIVKGRLGKNRPVRLRINAADVSLSLSKPTGSSILNILPAKILTVIEETGSEMLLQLETNDDILLARISRKSYQQLRLQFDMQVFVQIKGVLLHSDRQFGL